MSVENQESTKQTQVKQQLLIMGLAIDDLQKNLEMLQDQLTPVLSTYNEKEEAKAVNPEVKLCDLAETLKGKTGRVKYVSQKIDRILKTLEL